MGPSSSPWMPQKHLHCLWASLWERLRLTPRPSVRAVIKPQGTRASACSSSELSAPQAPRECTWSPLRHVNQRYSRVSLPVFLGGGCVPCSTSSVQPSKRSFSQSEGHPTQVIQGPLSRHFACRGCALCLYNWYFLGKVKSGTCNPVQPCAALTISC